MPQKRTGAARRRQPRNKKTLSAVISAVLVLAAVLVYYFRSLKRTSPVPRTQTQAPPHSPLKAPTPPTAPSTF